MSNKQVAATVIDKPTGDLTGNNETTQEVNTVAPIPTPESVAPDASISKVADPIPTTAANKTNGAVEIQRVCAKDLATFCEPEAQVLLLLHEVGDEVDPLQIVNAMEKVHMCMAKHADALSTACVNTLVTTIAQINNNDPQDSTTNPALVVTEDREPVDEDSSTEISIFYSKHHKAGHAGGVRSAPPLAMQHHAEPSTVISGGTDYSAIWMLMLPFFFVGLYVTITQARLYFLRRREIRRIESKQYVPVN